MSKTVPHIVEDPEGLKSILKDNPKLMVETLHTLVEDWDGFWTTMRTMDRVLYNNLKMKFTKDEQMQANRQNQSSSSNAMPGNAAMTAPPPCDRGEAAEQSNNPT